jgi:hypothetical protein
MNKEKKARLMQCTTFDEILDVEYGPKGTPTRDEFDKEAQAFCLAQTLKEEERLMQEQQPTR